MKTINWKSIVEFVVSHRRSHHEWFTKVVFSTLSKERKGLMEELEQDMYNPGWVNSIFILEFVQELVGKTFDIRNENKGEDFDITVFVRSDLAKNSTPFSRLDLPTAHHPWHGNARVFRLYKQIVRKDNADPEAAYIEYCSYMRAYAQEAFSGRVEEATQESIAALFHVSDGAFRQRDRYIARVLGREVNTLQSLVSSVRPPLSV